MQTVADELEVDVTTLYRHVRGVDELRRIWATQVAPTVKTWPDSAGETWESWLGALARYYRVALRDDPDLLEFANAALDPDFEGLERATQVLVDFGFEPRAAVWAHSFLINQVVGFVAQELRDRADAERGKAASQRLFQALEDARQEGRLPMLRSLEFHPKDFEGEAMFDLFLEFVIDGIRAQPGAPRRKRQR
jgi:hypothetical protein